MAVVEQNNVTKDKLLAQTVYQQPPSKYSCQKANKKSFFDK